MKMKQRSGLAGMGIVVNAPYMGEWPLLIGQFVLNFGGIEYISYQTLRLLKVSDEEFLAAARKPFGPRTELIVDLLSGATLLAPEQRASAIERWAEAREFAKLWRNRIIHNPVLPTWKPGSDSDNAPPDHLGIADADQFKEGVSDSIPLELLRNLVNHAVEVAKELSSVCDRLHAASKGHA